MFSEIDTNDRRLIGASRLPFSNLRVDERSVQGVMETRKELSHPLSQQEEYWKQNVKQYWLIGGDGNTKFFHMYALVRKRKNAMIMGIGVLAGGLQQLILDYFNRLYASSGCEVGQIMAHVRRKVTDDQNRLFHEPFMAREVKETLFSMHPDKFLSPDGLNSGFYQACWDVVGEEVSAACLDVLNNGHLPRDVNATLLVLIPKNKRS